ncbi:carbon-nitrogen hydrolase family protein [Halodurantibacterium flavum]|uniref:Carbon-nitrogen hydrolase family protein n=1 Tax=Halodurantibacterium flavum TaxID=1382802 RepID=A0ABW4S2Y8_9RHOB
MPRIAAAAYPLDWFDDWSAYEGKITRWVDEAAGMGAELLVFPEYGAMELASLGGADVAADLEGSLREVAAHRDAVDRLHIDLAARHRVHILGASGPVFDGVRPVNRATLYGPGGILGHQDKQIMTRFEAEEWDVVAGSSLTLFDTPIGRIGVIICYDSEFPLLARRLVEAGAEILLAPSCTETLAGFTRVRVGSMARALENQCVVVHAPTVGAAEWCPAVDMNRGRAAIYGPPDRGWPETGILAETALDFPGWATATVRLEAIAEVRRDGGVLNHRDWAEQARRDPQVKLVR